MSQKPSSDLEGVFYIIFSAALIVAGMFLFFFGLLVIAVVAVLAAIAVAIRAWFNRPSVLEKRARELTLKLYEQAKRDRAKLSSAEDFGRRVFAKITPLPEGLDELLVQLVVDLYVEAVDVPEPPSVCNSIAGIEYRDEISRVPDEETLFRIIAVMAHRIADHVPPENDEGVPFPMRFRDIVDNELVQDMVVPFFLPDAAPYWKPFREYLRANWHRSSGVPNTPSQWQSDKLIFPSMFEGDAVEAYLQGTPFMEILDASVPFVIPDKARFEHTIITAGCLHPDTPILDPTDGTEHTVSRRCSLGVPFHVYALSDTGDIVIAEAAPPQAFKNAPMWKLSNGEHSIVVTPNHRVWDGSSYTRVATLLASAAIHLPTISGNALSALRANGPRSARTDGDSLFDYRLSSRLCDRPPRAEADTASAFAPSRADAHAPCYMRSGADDLARKSERIRSCRFPARPSMQGSESRSCSMLANEWARYEVAGTSESPDRLPPLSFVFGAEKGPVYTDRAAPPPDPCSIETYTEYTAWTKEPVTDAVYYDFHVPVFNNYYAAGLFHHNTGHGKTTLLEHMLLYDIAKGNSVVVIDSQQELIRKVTHLAALKGRSVVLIDPTEDPALNIFDMNEHRQAGYGEAQREMIYNQTLETFRYLFSSLLGADLTVKQGAVFNNIIALMLTMPKAKGRNATLKDIMDLMENHEPYLDAIETLDPIARDFFLTDFAAPRKENQYTQTRQEIRYRLQALLSNKTLQRLVLAPKNAIDWFDHLNRGSIILVDTNKAFLGETNSGYFGKLAITLALNAILERAIIQGPKKTTMVYVDEASAYFDKSIETFLTEARKQRAGIILAHQHLGQMSSDFRASVISQTSVKFAGGLSAGDARFLASDMDTTDDFIRAQPKLSFACHVKGSADAVSIRVQPGLVDKLPKLSDDEFTQFRTRNRNSLRALPPPPLEIVPPPRSPASEPPQEVTSTLISEPAARPQREPPPPVPKPSSHWDIET